MYLRRKVFSLGGYDYLDLLKERAFSEGYEARMEEQRMFGILSAIGSKTGITSLKNSFNKARESGKGIIDSLKSAKARNNKQTVDSIKRQHDRLSKTTRELNVAEEILNKRRREHSREGISNVERIQNMVLGNNGRRYQVRDWEGRNFYRNATQADKDSIIKNINSNRLVDEDYTLLASHMRDLKQSRKANNEAKTGLQNIISNIGK